MTKYRSPVLSNERLCLLPIQHPKLYELYKKHESTFWTPEEVDLSKDLQDWKEATHDEKEMLKKILSFFAVADGIVMENASDNFSGEVKAPEARMFYAFQLAMEAAHVVVYNQTIQTYLHRDEAELHRLLSNVSHYKSVQAKVEFARKWMSADKSFAERIVAFSCVEGILFSSSFAIIYWFKNSNRFPGLTFSNELISRDEALHTEFAVALYKELIAEEQISKSLIKQIVHDAVLTETVFVRESVPSSLPNLTVDAMCDYVKHVGNVLLGQYGISTERVVLSKELDFMQLINLNQKTNFFEDRVSNYSKHVPEPSERFSIDVQF